MDDNIYYKKIQDYLVSENFTKEDFPLEFKIKGRKFRITELPCVKLKLRDKPSSKLVLNKRPVVSLRSRVSGLIINRDKKIRKVGKESAIRRDILQIINHWNKAASTAPIKHCSPFRKNSKLVQTESFTKVHKALRYLLDFKDISKTDILFPVKNNKFSITRKLSVAEICKAIDRFAKVVLYFSNTNSPKYKKSAAVSILGFVCGSSFMKVPSSMFSFCMSDVAMDREINSFSNYVKEEYAFQNTEEQIGVLIRMWKGSIDSKYTIKNKDYEIFDKAYTKLLPIVKEKTLYGVPNWGIISTAINNSWKIEKPSINYLLTDALLELINK